jgi:hypothetical protein
MASWYSRPVRTTRTFRLNGDSDTGYVVRTVLRLTKATKAATGRDIELQLTAAEARSLAKQLLDQADNAERINHDAGYRIDLPRT